MNSIPDLSHDSIHEIDSHDIHLVDLHPHHQSPKSRHSNESNSRNMVNTFSLTRNPTSLDNTTNQTSLDRTPHTSIHNTTTEQEFQRELNRLKRQSTKKFRTKWEEILEKYSNVDDDLESDEIDLFTGEILTDNGHLRSLRLTERSSIGMMAGDIWGSDWEMDQRSLQLQEKKDKVQKEQLRSKLKELKVFHKSHELSPLPKLRLSPLKAWKPTEDNITFLSPSPKKFRSSPIRLDTILDNIANGSPIKRKRESRGENTNSRISNNGSPMKRKRAFDSHANSAESYANVAESYTNVAVSNRIESHASESYANESTANESNANESNANESNANESYADHGSFTVYPEVYSPASVSSPELSSESVFEEEYLILSDLPQLGIPNYTSLLYQCAFKTCSYCTGNKSIYQAHLLKKHIVELNILKYPVEASTIKSQIEISREEEEILKIQFPLTFHIRDPLICGKVIDDKTCTKFFFTEKELDNHLCSAKVQVLVCPILGCGYMAEGYDEWRGHFRTHQEKIKEKAYSPVKKTKEVVYRSISGGVEEHENVEIVLGENTRLTSPKIKQVTPRKLSVNVPTILTESGDWCDINFEDVGHESIDELFDD